MTVFRGLSFARPRLHRHLRVRSSPLILREGTFVLFPSFELFPSRESPGPGNACLSATLAHVFVVRVRHVLFAVPFRGSARTFATLIFAPWFVFFSDQQLIYHDDCFTV